MLKGDLVMFGTLTAVCAGYGAVCGRGPMGGLLGLSFGVGAYIVWLFVDTR